MSQKIGTLNFLSQFKVFLDKYKLIKKSYKLVLKEGLNFNIRPKNLKSVSDIDIFNEIVTKDQYMIRSYIENINYVIDIGAQIGIFSILISKLSGATVYAYEPNEDNFSLLRQNIANNKQKTNVFAYNKAVSNKKGRILMFKSHDNSGGHSIHQMGPNEESFYVESITLNDIINDHKLKKVDLIKMDCEGSEYEIIRSTPDKILNKIKNIVMEVHVFKNREKEMRGNLNIMKKRLQNLGYKLKLLNQIYYPSEGYFEIIWACKENS